MEIAGLSTSEHKKMSVERREAGVGLIEILVALLVTAIGLLGLAALQGTAQQAEMESYQRSQALILLEDMASRLRANRAERDSYVLADPVGTGSAGAGCDGTTACRDIQTWHEQLLGAAETQGAGPNNQRGAMIGARGCITGGGRAYTVTVAWQGIVVDNQELDSLPANDPRRSNGCGQGMYGPDAQRRIVSAPVRFSIHYP
jgi:type IV pilus assembly protein PilV